MATTIDLNLMSAARRSLLLDPPSPRAQKQPFFASLAMTIKLAIDTTCPTAWVDGVSLGYNPEYVASLTRGQRIALVAHEILHAALGHLWRRGDRDLYWWNVACDKVVNYLLQQAGFELPPDLFIAEGDEIGKSAEWIYSHDQQKRMEEKQKEKEQEEQDEQGEDEEQDGSGSGEDEPEDEESGDEGDSGDEQDESDEDGEGDGQGEGEDESDGGGGGTDGQPGKGDGSGEGEGESEDGSGGGTGTGDGKGEGTGNGGGNAGAGDDDKPSAGELFGGEMREAPAIGEDGTPNPGEEDWKDRVRVAVTQAQMQGLMPGNLSLAVEDAIEPRYDVFSILLQFCQERARDDYSWSRPNHRYSIGGIIMPSLHSEAMGEMAVLIDTSGSIDHIALAKARGYVERLIDELHPRRLWVVYADAAVKRVDCFEAGEMLEWQPQGGGGTNFIPALEWIDANTTSICTMAISDLDGTFPETAPTTPILWLSTLKRNWRGEEMIAPFGDTVYVGD